MGLMIECDMDLVMGLVLLIALIPMILVAAVLVAVSMGRPIFVAQTRPGHHERRFVMLKFHIMSDRRRADGELLPGAERLGRLGRFLRASSLDELPELVNVLRGDMGLVGPRPLLPEYLPLYDAQ